MDLAACDEIGQSQDGLITRRQALQVLSEEQVDHLLETKTWDALYPGVYRLTGVPVTWLRRVRGTTMSRPDDLIASRRTAAYLWGLLERQPRKVDVLAPFTSSARLPNATVHRTRAWHDNIATTIDGIPLTRPARSLVDLSADCSRKTLRKAIDLAITSRIVTLDDIIEELDLIGTRGRSRCKMLFGLLAQRDERFARTESMNAIEVLEWIRESGLPLPTPEFRVPVSANDTYRLDFAYLNRKIGIEVQSWRWHGGPSKQEDDAAKALAVTAMGWVLLPVLPRRASKPDFIAALQALLASRPAA